MNDDVLFDITESPDGFLYYTKGDRGNGIYRRPISGGPESQIPGAGATSLYRYWAVAKDAVYFVDGPPNATLRLWDPRKRDVRAVSGLASTLVRGPRGLAVSPDGSTVLYAAEDLSLSDIMLLIKE
jgi:hypothetical protein